MMPPQVYYYNGQRVWISRWEAGQGTADYVVTWSDGRVERGNGCGRTRRELYLRDRNQLEPQEVVNYQASPTSEDFEFKPPSAFKVNAIDVPWRLAQQPIHAPRIVQRPEFHARSNPRSR